MWTNARIVRLTLARATACLSALPHVPMRHIPTPAPAQQVLLWMQTPSPVLVS